MYTTKEIFTLANPTQYNTSYTDVTWETCILRKWLNNDFINAAFSADEKAMIPTVTVSADKNPEYSTNPGNSGNSNCLWLLRSPGDFQAYAPYVDDDGDVNEVGYRVNYHGTAVRPALWIDLNS